MALSGSLNHVSIHADPQLTVQQSSPSKWRSFCLQSKCISVVAVVVGLTLILSSVLLNEQMNMSSFLDRVAASSKTEGLSVNGNVGCDLSRKSTSNSTSNSTGDEARELCRQGKQVGENIPHGMIVATTDLQMRSLYEEDEQEVQKAMKKNLLAMAVGIKQKNGVDEIVQKFPLNNFTIMLFHYDGIVDQWQDLAWSNQSIHIVALRQTKWWFAKRFMHPDIVDQYNYIFLWDEDLGVEHFHADRYLEIMKAEGLEISQPALDNDSLEIHHRITRRHPRLTAHKSIVTPACPADNKGVPCTGYVEVMAPVFTKAAWQCVWHMVQNDLIHGWGIDFKIGYCAQGLRSEKVGVIDAEYILHKGIPSLGGQNGNKSLPAQNDSDSEDSPMTGTLGAGIEINFHRMFVTNMRSLNRRFMTPAKRHVMHWINHPYHIQLLFSKVRKKSSQELIAFQRRWAQAVRDDPTWKDPYKAYAELETYHGKPRASAVSP